MRERRLTRELSRREMEEEVGLWKRHELLKERCRTGDAEDWRTKCSRRGTTDSEDEVVRWDKSRSLRVGWEVMTSTRKGREAREQLDVTRRALRVGRAARTNEEKRIS